MAAATPAAVPPGDPEAAMAVAVHLAAENVRRRSGGPFGALVLDGAGTVVGAGVNVVQTTGSSLAHAEVKALLAAQARLGRPRLNDEPGGPFVLATSAQPCVMCFGTAFWAGLDALWIGARAADVETLTGFDEGPLPEDWPGALAARGISVTHDLLREQAREVLTAYAAAGGERY
ncbi:MAG: nucleoside deaminase [Solirubrobacterales bacterium]|nr:nucleoside deaminase [Solirubrobacterales bacterium]